MQGDKAIIRLLNQADVMVVIRTGLSESGAFELAYNIFGGRRVPVFFAIWKNTPLETTLSISNCHSSGVNVVLVAMDISPLPPVEPRDG